MCQDAEHSRPVFKQAGEHRLVALQLRHHRGKGGQSRSSKPTFYPDRVQARQRGHVVMLRPDLVRRQRRNLVIVCGTAPGYVGNRERPVDRSLSSRARLTAEERSRVPSFE